MAALLTVNAGSTDKVAALYRQLSGDGIEVMPSTIMPRQIDFTSNRGTHPVGLSGGAQPRRWCDPPAAGKPRISGRTVLSLADLCDRIPAQRSTAGR